MLPGAGGIPPYHAAAIGNCEALQPSDVFIRHRGLFGPGDGLLPQQVRAAIDRILQRTGENTGFESVKYDFETGSFGFYAARGRVISGPGLADFFGLARQTQVGSGAARNHQGRVPESIPFFALDHFGRKLDVQLLHQRIDLLLREAAHAARDFELGREIPSQHDPFAVALARGEFADRGPAIADRKRGAQLLVAFPLPGDFDGSGAVAGLQSRLRPVTAQIAILGKRRAGPESGANENPLEFHAASAIAYRPLPCRTSPDPSSTASARRRSDKSCAPKGSTRTRYSAAASARAPCAPGRTP